MRPAGGSLIAEIFDVETRGKANGIFNWGVYFGIGLTFTLGNYVFQQKIFNAAGILKDCMSLTSSKKCFVTNFMLDDPS